MPVWSYPSFSCRENSLVPLPFKIMPTGTECTKPVATGVSYDDLWVSQYDLNKTSKMAKDLLTTPCINRFLLQNHHSQVAPLHCTLISSASIVTAARKSKLNPKEPDKSLELNRKKEDAWPRYLKGTWGEIVFWVNWCKHYRHWPK